MKPSEEQLAAIDSLVAEYQASRSAHEEIRTRLDIAVMSAKMAGATFRELSDRTNMSVGWVQKALSRRGYVPRSPNDS